jgi:hypothetical protein
MRWIQGIAAVYHAARRRWEPLFGRSGSGYVRAMPTTRPSLRSLSTLALASAIAAGCGGGTTTDDAAVLPDSGMPPLDAFSPVDAPEANDALVAGDAPALPDAVVVRPDAFVSVDATAPTMPTYTYVVSVVAADRVVSGAVAGINVDGIDSGRGSRVGTCQERHPDYVSSITALPGVDNQLSGSLLSALESGGLDINRNLANGIAMGEFLLLITVDGIDDFVDDPEVTVTFALGETASGGAPTTSGGLLAPGQRFRVSTPLGAGMGHIAGNRLEANVAAIPLPLVIGDPASVTDLADAQITARITADRLFDGEGGGGVSVEDLIAFAESNGQGALARSLLPMFADLEPSATDPLDCASISAGFRLEAVSAMIVP